jgi:uncharacterized membrane protein
MSELDWTTTFLVAAIILGGLNAGLFYGFACAVMPGLGQVDDRAFVTVLQSINRRIINPVFLLVFIGAPVLAIGALVLVAVTGQDGLWAAILGAAFSLLTIVVTGAVNVPLNNALDAAGEPDRIRDPGQVRRAFETPWVRWNVARTASSLGAFAFLVVTVVG